jgi:integrase
MSLSRAMNRLATAAGVSGAGLHDLRRTGSTAMTSERLSVSPFIRSKVLGHSTDAGGGASVSMLHYDTNEYLAERRKALELWEKRLLEIVQHSSKSTPIPQGCGRDA